MSVFPRYKHHAKHGAKLVQSQEHLDSLGEGWGDDSIVWRQHLAKEDAFQPKAPEAAPEPQSEAQAPKAKKGKKNAP